MNSNPPPQEEQYFSPIINDHKTSCFIGRQTLIDEIHTTLTKLKSGERLLVLQGLGGQGKTQAAIRYSNIHFFDDNYYKMVFWIDASNERTASEGLCKIADAVGSPEIKHLEQSQKIENIRRYLGERNVEWLLVLDNFDSPKRFKNVKAFIPSGNTSNILVTSRHQDTSQLGSVVHVPGMNDEEAIALLMKQATLRSQPSPSDFELCREIVHNFGNLPLAVSQAGAYMRTRNMKPSVFIKRYRNNRAAILKYRPEVWDYKKDIGEGREHEVYFSAFTTWELSLNEAGKIVCKAEDKNGDKYDAEQTDFDSEKWRVKAADMQPAAQLLLLSAFLDRNEISEALFETATMAPNSHTLPWLRDCCTTNGRWDSEKFGTDLVGELSKLSLTEQCHIDEDEDKTVYSLHPLVQEWAKLRLNVKERYYFFLQSVWLLADFLDPDSYETSQIRNKTLILQNLDEILRNDDDISTMEGDPLTLLGMGELIPVALRFGSYYVDHGHYTDARAVYERIIDRNKSPGIVEELHFLNATEGIAIVDMLEGHYTEAEASCKIVLDGYTKLLGMDNYERLRALRNLTEIKGGQGDFREVIPNYVEIVTTFEKLLGPDHLITLREVEGLGNAYRVNKRYTEAAPLLCRALKGMERLLSPEHPDLLGVVESLAIVKQGQKLYGEAEKLYTRSLEGNESSLGPNHPDTLNVVEELGNLWAAQGCLEVAIPFYERVRIGRCKILGAEHPDTQRAIQYLEELRDAPPNVCIEHDTPFYPWYRSISDYAQALKE